MTLSLPDFGLNRKSTIFSDEHEAFRDVLKRFVASEVAPYAADWDEANEFPRELYKKAADIGLLGIMFPEAYGGTGVDYPLCYLASVELGRAGTGGISAGLMSHAIGTPPIANLGSPELKERVLPDILSGKKISALAITEPGGGSDVQNLKTRAHRENGHYILSGEKTFITSGMRADYYTVAVRTGDTGMGGISLMLVEKGMEGFTQTPLQKMGWWASDTATLHFDNVKVPAGNLIGGENAGFMGIMMNFNNERLFLASACYGHMLGVFEEALEWAKQRETFGKPLIHRQVIRHKFVDMAMKMQAVRSVLEELAQRLQNGESPVTEICLVKNLATSTLEYVANECLQILGGAGYMRGTKVERVYRETKVMTIGGGSSEIMKDLASRQMGL
ncbi:Acyl-CoA dehydrogenase [Pseudovibrio axinellae]|uniref:Acyl-CoA dehydrogenase n=1 Tax=Pseudovibrio axinellae TaxID=989403 RepID=A0A165XQT2_9HYPH|nr:acyl-CoA dehydrogenase family protein [Pseudovibrio axinellae]KZL17951.1 Acyl-CoA dehydrogenase [Pseudovibrio axinellae]SER15558.1 acyl-CoA dehydrogenase [Pseudovibrio axinellae]